MPNTRKNVETRDATLRENTQDGKNDFKMILGKKFEELKTYIISELAESVKHIIETEIQEILKDYSDKVTSTVEMLQQRVSHLKFENSVMQDKGKAYGQKFDSRCGESEQYQTSLPKSEKYQEK